MSEDSYSEEYFYEITFQDCHKEKTQFDKEK